MSTIRIKERYVPSKGRYVGGQTYGYNLAASQPATVKRKLAVSTIPYQQLPQSGMRIHGEQYVMPHEDQVKLTQPTFAGKPFQFIGFLPATSLMVIEDENPWRKFRGMFANNPRYENVKKKMAERREQRRLAEIANGS